MPQVFAIAAQIITLPDGSQLDLRVNQTDSSLVEIHQIGRKDGVQGTHILTFKRNGGAQDVAFHPSPVQKPSGNQAVLPADSPLAGFKTVDDGAVRGSVTEGNENQASKSSQSAPSAPTPSDLSSKPFVAEDGVVKPA